jgi:RNA polymerase sigma-70 factor (family 1)
MGINVNSSDQELVVSLHDGNVEAFDLIFKKYSTRLYSFAFKYLKSKSDTEELVQNVFVKIWENRSTLKQESSLKAYLFTISYHDICKCFRSRMYAEKLKSQIINSNRISFNPNDQFDYQSVLEQIDKIIDKMPARQKEVFVKSRKDGKSSREIAAELNLAPGTVDNHISEALKFIRKNMGNNLSFLLFFAVFLR